MIRRNIVHVVMTITLLAAGCDSPRQDNGQQTFLDPGEMAAEYYQETERLKLPPGAQWKPAPILPSYPDGSGVMRGNTYEIGWGKSTAQARWYCAWLSEWADQYGKDAARTATALEQLRKLPTMEQYTRFSDDGTRVHFDQLLAKFELGDVSAAHNHLRTNCVDAD
ncbi:hypothetical protein [Allorhizocola rhizosphaerae]|uniref:hypothetical protein n=1 Tax=Allorhizocola rhizosphaerae TaxID=1872709 RepID=UPI000E3D8079|nr:hypothetical protein [Allorhizocola rhizosphaerae]